jgi:hypothetical protein
MKECKATMGLKTIKAALNYKSDTLIILAIDSNTKQYVVFEEDWVEEFGFMFSNKSEREALDFWMDHVAAERREYDEQWKSKYGHINVRELLGFPIV